MNAETFFLYLATWSLVALTPGPAVMCAMSQATRYGFRYALIGIAGIQGGHLVFFACVASGLAALLASASAAFGVLRVLGAVYLLYLGIRVIASSFRSRAVERVVSNPPSSRNLLLQGFLIQVTNPKALLFMSALLPQFIQARHSLALQICVLLGATIAVDTLVLGAYAYFALHGARQFRTSGAAAWLERTFGAVLVLFGVRLLAARK